MQIGFYGGSFNPPHYGHFLAASWALLSGEVEQVWMVPCLQHAFGKELEAFAHRVAMCELGAKGLGQQLQVSRIEEELGGPSYTIDTMEALVARHREHRFRLLVGSDILDEREQWKSFDRLRSLAPLLVVPRAQYEQQEQEGPMLAIPNISSTDIRQRLQAEQTISGVVPPMVLQYIADHHLYRVPF